MSIVVSVLATAFVACISLIGIIAFGAMSVGILKGLDK